MKITKLIMVAVVLLLTACSQKPQESAKMRALIIDGQNNHGIWPKTTMMMKSYLEETGLFTVDVARTTHTWQGPHNDNDEGLGEQNRKALLDQFGLADGRTYSRDTVTMPDSTFAPDFSSYQLVISNFGWLTSPLPQSTQDALEKFVNNGGGLVIVHAANNAWPEWLAFNKMIAVGGWGDRNEKSGPYIYFNDNNEFVRDTTAGPAGSHGYQYAFKIMLRDTLHPITAGMPATWMHNKDEMYDRLRGPAENVSVLASMYSDVTANASFFSPLKGTGHHEPAFMTIEYGKGRVFHTPLGHADYSMECVGFITLIQRGAEWAATGKVSQALPSDFPGPDSVSTRKWSPKNP